MKRLQRLSLWLKVKCLNGYEFFVVGWTDLDGRSGRGNAARLRDPDPAGLCRPRRHRQMQVFAGERLADHTVPKS